MFSASLMSTFLSILSILLLKELLFWITACYYEAGTQTNRVNTNECLKMHFCPIICLNLECLLNLFKAISVRGYKITFREKFNDREEE